MTEATSASVETATPFTITWPIRLWLGVVVVIAICARLWFMHGIALWIDDYHSISFSTGHGWAVDSLPRNTLIHAAPDLVTLANAKPVWSVWTSLDSEPNPPLYFLLLRVWREIGFDFPVGMRLLSIGFSVLSILLLFDAARHQLLSPTRCILAALLLAVANIFISTSVDLRAFAMLTCLVAGILSVISRTELRGPSRLRLALLTLLPCLMMLSHYYALPICVATGLYVLWRFQGAVRLKLLGCLVASGVLWSLVWGSVLVTQSLGTERHFYMVDTTPNHTLVTIQRALTLPMRLLAEVVPSSLWIAAVAGVMLVILSMVRVRKQPIILLCLLVVILPIVMLFVRDLLDTTFQLFLVRFTVATTPALVLMIALVLPGRAGLLLQSSLIAYSLLGLTNQSFTNARENYTAMGNFYALQIQQADLVVFTHPKEQSDLAMLYYVMTYHAGGAPRVPVLLSQRMPTADDVALVRPFKRVLIVRGWGPDNVESQFVPGYRLVHRFNEAFIGGILVVERGLE
jgi:Dolichyl-phosphate-mannose-protein mannosyltransferase